VGDRQSNGVHTTDIDGEDIQEMEEGFAVVIDNQDDVEEASDGQNDGDGIHEAPRK
jgi:hypothetical protein